MVDRNEEEHGTDRDDLNLQDSDIDEARDAEGKSVWAPRFMKNWLGGEALEYAKTNHLPTFLEKNAADPKEGTAYGLACANELMSVFGEFGPWGADSEAKVPDEDDDDDRPYDYVSDDEDADGQVKTGAKKRVLKRKRSEDGAREETIQEVEARQYKRAHIERLRKSYLNWLRYRYKFHEGGNTARGRVNRQKVSKKSKPDAISASATGEELSTLLVHELLGIGETKARVPHAFQLWSKDLPEKTHKSFLKRFQRGGGKARDRAGAEMHYFAGKFNKLDVAVRQEYYDKRAELKAAAEAKREELAEKVKTRLDPEDAANLIDVMPLLLDPLLTSLSAMLNAKISLLIGVPHPREGGELVIKALDKGDNNDPIPVSLGKTTLFAPIVDAFSQFCDDAYSTAELKASAMPGTLPKSPQKKKVKNADGREKVMIVVQNMALPEDGNQASGKAAAENGDDSDDSGDEIARRRRRCTAREERERRREDEGEPVKRPRGRPRKKVVAEEDEISGREESVPRPKKTMPEPAAKRRKVAKTTTASGVATLGEVSTSRGRKKPEASISESRKKLMELAGVASGNGRLQRNGRVRVPSPSPERSRSPRPSAKRQKRSLPATPDTPCPSTQSTHAKEPPPRPRPRPLKASKPVSVDPPDATETSDDPSQSTPPVQRRRSRSRSLTVIPEEDEHEALPQDILMEDLDLGDDFIDSTASLDVEEFEAPIPNLLANGLFSDNDVPLGSPLRPSNVNNVSGERRVVAVKPPAKTNVAVVVPVRVSRAGQRIPPTGDHKHKSSGSRQKPPSVRAKPPLTRASSQAPQAAPLNPFDRTRWSDWFKGCYEQFESISTDEWRTMINLWTQVEGLAGFNVGKYVNLEVDSRPKLLSDWVNTRRVREMVVPRADLKKFVANFWAWYIALQPEWRDVAGLDGPLSAETRLPPNGRDWGLLYSAKGRNGLVSVIACLSWWGRHHMLTKGPLGLVTQWDEAVADVTYVLEGLLAAGWEV